MQTNYKSEGLLNVSRQEIYALFKSSGNKDGVPSAALILISLILTPITLFGAFLGYKRAYTLFMQDESPRLYNLRPIVKIAMLFGAVLMWVFIYFAAKLMTKAMLWMIGDTFRHSPIFLGLFLLMNVVITILLFVSFNQWRKRIKKIIEEKRRHGSARFATEDELKPYRRPLGFYIGRGLYYNKPGHLTTVAGTRGGKLANLISYNVLQPHLFEGNTIILDPKGELNAISQRIQHEAGRKTITINPWQLLSLGNASYNPLELLGNSDDPNLVDDVQMVVESLVPMNPNSKDPHWDEKAKTILTGLLLHLIAEYHVSHRTLEKIWAWLRMPNDEWAKLLADMKMSENPFVGDIISATGNEIINLMTGSDREYSSVMSCVQRHTDFIKSPVLRNSMVSSNEFNLEDLKTGNTTIYVVIPFDRISTQSKWLRLVITSFMRYAVRNSCKTRFILDEAYALGYHSEIMTAMGAYAGMGISVWSIFQNLGQIKELYGQNWEGFLGNASVRHFFNIADNQSADYISKMLGKTSVPEFDDKGDLKGASARDLVTSDELRRQSGDKMYAVIDNLPPAIIPKAPYYLTNIDCDPNPYQMSAEERQKWEWLRSIDLTEKEKSNQEE